MHSTEITYVVPLHWSKISHFFSRLMLSHNLCLQFMCVHADKILKTNVAFYAKKDKKRSHFKIYNFSRGIMPFPERSFGGELCRPRPSLAEQNALDDAFELSRENAFNLLKLNRSRMNVAQALKLIKDQSPLSLSQKNIQVVRRPI